MKIFEVSPDENWPHNYSINAAHKWGLPGVECPDCGMVGGRVGSQYPNLSLPKGVDATPYLDGFPVSSERQRELQSALLNQWNVDVQLFPGTQFGPLVGKGSGKCGDVAWVNGWTLLFSETAIEKLTTAGVLSLSLTPAEIHWRSKKPLNYFEANISPRLKLATSYCNALGCLTCKTCKLTRCRKELTTRQERLAYEELGFYPVLDSAAVSSRGNWSLLRVENWESKIIASEHFKIAAEHIGLTNISFRELQVSAL